MASRYKSVNLTPEQMERAEKLVELTGLNFNRLMRLFIEKAQPDDIEELLSR